MSELFTQDLDDFHDVAPPADDREDRERDDRRREVNETFQRGRERPQDRPRAKPVHADEDQGGMPAARPSEQSWASYVAKVCTERRDYWQAEMAMAKVPPADRNRHENEMPNQHEVVNHFITHAVERGVLKPEDISKDGKPDGPRDPAKAKAAMGDLFRRAPRRVMAAVDAYFGERERAIRVRLGMDDLEDTGGQDAAEVVSQETVGREPGSDDDR